MHRAQVSWDHGSCMTNTHENEESTAHEQSEYAQAEYRAASASGNPSTGEMQLADRGALRRVAGLSTELEDVTEVEYRQLRLERVVLVGVWTQGTAEQAEASMTELAALAETAGSEVLEGLVQRRDKPDAATYIGSGKAQELREVVLATGADTVVCDGELTPAQLTALEKIVKVKVIDRTALILDIFAQHATSREGKAQVAFAQMEYMLPRLRGWGESMSRQAGGRAGSNGGVGLRGPGETKIETDRRRIRERMAKLRREIKGMKPLATPSAHVDCRATSRRSPSSDTPTRANRVCSIRSPDRVCSWRTRCSPPWTRPLAAQHSTTAASTFSPTRSASCDTCRLSWSRHSAQLSRK